MTQHGNRSEQSGKPTSLWKSGVGVALIMVGLVVTFYLIREHWTHLGQTWPYLLLLLCPLMHLMHGGHGHRFHGNHRHSDPTDQTKKFGHKDDNRVP